MGEIRNSGEGVAAYLTRRKARERGGLVLGVLHGALEVAGRRLHAAHHLVLLALPLQGLVAGDGSGGGLDLAGGPLRLAGIPVAGAEDQQAAGQGGDEGKGRVKIMGRSSVLGPNAHDPDWVPMGPA
ncbi:hypothetical protein CSW58_01370 [Caulobacter sp. B11]|nr:hypothetical protein CSW58_01370 [Caulobacter sp. B11]